MKIKERLAMVYRLGAIKEANSVLSFIDATPDYV
jgi:hypothetical protein